MVRSMARICTCLAIATATSLASPSPSEAGEVQISIQNFKFDPPAIAVAPGTKVVWINRDDEIHAIADSQVPPNIHSPALDQGDSFAYVFAKPGVYRIFCSLHPHMVEEITVK